MNLNRTAQLCIIASNFIKTSEGLPNFPPLQNCPPPPPSSANIKKQKSRIPALVPSSLPAAKKGKFKNRTGRIHQPPQKKAEKAAKALLQAPEKREKSLRPPQEPLQKRLLQLQRQRRQRQRDLERGRARDCKRALQYSWMENLPVVEERPSAPAEEKAAPALLPDDKGYEGDCDTDSDWLFEELLKELEQL